MITFSCFLYGTNSSVSLYNIKKYIYIDHVLCESSMYIKNVCASNTELLLCSINGYNALNDASS